MSFVFVNQKNIDVKINICDLLNENEDCKHFRSIIDKLPLTTYLEVKKFNEISNELLKKMKQKRNVDKGKIVKHLKELGLKCSLNNNHHFDKHLISINNKNVEQYLCRLCDVIY